MRELRLREPARREVLPAVWHQHGRNAVHQVLCGIGTQRKVLRLMRAGQRVTEIYALACQAHESGLRRAHSAMGEGIQIGTSVRPRHLYTMQGDQLELDRSCLAVLGGPLVGDMANSPH